MTDKLSIQITMEDNMRLKSWPNSLTSLVESPSCHNGFPLDLDDHKNKMESPPIFSVRVWSVTRDACS